MGWNLDLHAHEQIAVSITLHIFYALALKPKDRAGLRTCRHFDFGRASQSRDFNDASQRCVRETDRHFARQIIAVPAKNLVALNVENDV